MELHTDKSILSKFDVLGEQDGSSLRSNSSDENASVYEMNGLNRPPMNQEEFDQRFAYAKPKTESEVVRSAKKFLGGYYQPFTSCNKFTKTLRQRIPILDWLPRYNFRENIFYDLVGGTTVGIMHIPQGIAYAILAHVPAVVGLYTSLFPVLIYMLFGTSRHCSIGSFAVVALMSGKAIDAVVHDDERYNATLGIDGNSDLYIEAASSLCMLVGLVQLIVGFLGLSFITTYFSDEVVNGFTTGASVHVFVLQLKDVFGIKNAPSPNGAAYLFKRIIGLIEHASEANLYTIALSAGTFLVLMAGKEIINPLVQRKLKCPVPIPFELLVVILGTVICGQFHMDTNNAVKTVGPITSSFPAPQLPRVDLWIKLIPDALSISVVVVAVHISLAKMLAKQNKYQIDTNQEFYALGMTGALSGFFPVFPIACSLARTVVNSNAGGKTQLSSIFSCVVIACVIFFTGSLISALPMCVLATTIVVALRSMLGKFSQLKVLWPVSKIDFSIWLIAFVSTVCIDVMPGLAISIAYALFTTVMREQWPRWHLLANLNGTLDYRDSSRYSDTYFFNGVCIFRFDSPLLFTNVDRFKKTVGKLVRDWDNVRKPPASVYVVLENDKSKVRHLIVDCSGFTFIDSMGTQAMKEVFLECLEQDVQVMFASTKASLRETFAVSGLYNLVPKSSFFPTIYDAVAFATSPNRSPLISTITAGPNYENKAADLEDV